MSNRKHRTLYLSGADTTPPPPPPLVGKIPVKWLKPGDEFAAECKCQTQVMGAIFLSKHPINSLSHRGAPTHIPSTLITCF